MPLILTFKLVAVVLEATIFLTFVDQSLAVLSQCLALFIAPRIMLSIIDLRLGEAFQVLRRVAVWNDSPVGLNLCCSSVTRDGAPG